jgi:uncharacterized protein YktA (UPF0223 family)
MKNNLIKKLVGWYEIRMDENYIRRCYKKFQTINPSKLKTEFYKKEYEITSKIYTGDGPKESDAFIISYLYIKRFYK